MVTYKRFSKENLELYRKLHSICFSLSNDLTKAAYVAEDELNFTKMNDLVAYGDGYTKLAEEIRDFIYSVGQSAVNCHPRLVDFIISATILSLTNKVNQLAKDFYSSFTKDEIGSSWELQ